MANSTKGEIVLELEDGPTLTMQLNFAARVAVEDELGQSFADAARRAGEGWQGDLLVIMWAALKKHHDFSQEDVGELLDEHGAAMTAAMQRAAEAANPSADDAGNGEKPAKGNRAARRASKSSGRNGPKSG